MADKTKEARARRSESRGQRRARVEEPFEEMDQAAREQAQESTNSDMAGAAAKVVGTAAAAALLGALGGAAKALMERRGGEEQQGSEQPEESSDDEPVAEDSASAEPEGDEQNEQPEPPTVEEEPEEEAPQPAAAQRERETPQAQGVSADDGAEIVTQARRQLGMLLGTEAERVSGLERVDGGWTVSLEVVEVSRIPESTDVLATYEVKLDDDRNVVSVARKRRYRRSQVDDES